MTGPGEGYKEGLLMGSMRPTSPKLDLDQDQDQHSTEQQQTIPPIASGKTSISLESEGASSGGFQFVQVDNSGKPQNANLRTAVRSNARRHTKKERQRTKARAAPRSLAIKSNQTEQQGQHAPTLESVSESSGRSSNILAQGSSYTTNDAVTRVSPSNSPVLHNAPDVLGMPFTSGNRSSQQPQFDRWQNLSHEANTPYALVLGEEAPMLCMQANRWPFPFQLRSSQQPKALIWMPGSGIPVLDGRAPRDSLVRTAPPITWISRSLEFYNYKLETIRWVSEKLGDPAQSTSDVTIGVIICLTMWEIARSDNLEAAQHMEGVQRIINLRGGIDSLEDQPDFRLKILLVDLFTSVASMAQPRFLNLNKGPPEPPRKILGLDVHCILDSPLYRHRPQHRLDNVTVGPPFDKTSIRLLQIMRTLSLQPSLIVKTAHLSEAATIFQAEESNPNTTPLFKTILHTSLIYSRAFHIDPIAFSSPINRNSVDILIQELESEVNDEIWLRYPGVFLWILLTVAVATNGRPERAFVTQLFGKIVPVAKWGWWTEIRASMLTFLDIRRMAEGRISEIG